MIFLKLNLLVASTVFTFSIIFTTPSIAQERNIIGKRNKSIIKVIETPLNKKITKISYTKNLTQKVIKGINTDAEKAKRIFNWIATTIEYDHELRLSQKLQKEIYTSEDNVIKYVLLRKKALCGGYAFLFQKMCEDIGIQSEVIHGFTKVSGVKRKDNQIHHSWNAVKLNGEWQLLDITWARSNGKNSEPSEYWYATLPQEFLKTHLPENPKWQLLSRKSSY